MNAIEVCPKCNRMTFHIEDNDCVCSNCHYSLGSNEYWSTSLTNLRESRVQPVTHLGLYFCKMCGESFATEDELKKHNYEKRDMELVLA